MHSRVSMAWILVKLTTVLFTLDFSAINCISIRLMHSFNTFHNFFLKLYSYLNLPFILTIVIWRFKSWQKNEFETLLSLLNILYLIYWSFQRSGQPKFPDGGPILCSSQFSILPQLLPKILLNSKVVKIDPKIIISLH